MSSYLTDVFGSFTNLVALLKAYCDLAPMCDYDGCERLATRATPDTGAHWCDQHHLLPPYDVELKHAEVSRLIQTVLDSEESDAVGAIAAAAAKSYESFRKTIDDSVDARDAVAPQMRMFQQHMGMARQECDGRDGPRTRAHAEKILGRALR
jgi:hypothetical protein